MKLLTILILTASLLTISARELQPGDVISFLDSGKRVEGRIVAVIRQSGCPTVLHVYEFGLWKIVEVKAANKPLLIAATN